MKPEDKQLLLKDLSARLPYGVICHYNCVAEYDTMVLQKANCVNKLEGIIPFNGQIGYMVGGDKVNALSGDIKPYLRSMDSMTEEEGIEWFNYHHEIELEEVKSSGDYLKAATLGEIASIDWLNKNHFDYRGLIPMGLAIEVNKNNNPYKN